MAGIDTPLVFNLSTGSYVDSVANPVMINPPTWVQIGSKNLLITFVKNSTVPGMVTVLLALAGLTVSIGTAGSVASSNTATGPDANGQFTCVLDLSPGSVNALIGQAAILEFLIGPPNNSYQTPVTLIAAVNSGTVNPTPPGDTAMGIAAAKATFVSKDSGVNGDFFILRSAGGSAARIYLTDDYQLHPEPISPAP